MFRKLIELPTARMAIAELDTDARDAARAACRQIAGQLTQELGQDAVSTSRAYSGRWIAVGVAAGASIGVDIELARPRERLRDVATWLDLDATDEPEFYAHWTLREALAKSRGGSVLEAQAIEAQMRAAAHQPGELLETDGYAALCDRLAGGIYYSLVLNHQPDYEVIRCA